jgi:ParB-like chromosome segregation protein Spo0J
MAVKRNPRELEVAEPFATLFPVQAEVLELVKDSIRKDGFMSDKPILAWRDAFGDRGRLVVVDGHTRLKAALALKLDEVPVTGRQFKSVDAAITAGIGEQVQRRNLNREQIAAYVVSILPLLDEVKGGLRTRTAKQLAQLLGVSVPTIDRARGLLNSGQTDLIEAVKSGEISLLKAYSGLSDSPPPEEEPVPELSDDPEPEPAADPEPAAEPEPEPERAQNYKPAVPGESKLLKLAKQMNALAQAWSDVMAEYNPPSAEHKELWRLVVDATNDLADESEKWTAWLVGKAETG